MKIVVDTNILIDFSRKRKTQKAKILWPKLVSFAQKEGHQLIIPAVAIFEFFAAREMDDPTNREKADNILRDVIILDLTKEIAEMGATLFRKYQETIGPIDYLLAATAFILKGELATLNPKHFRIFKNLRVFDLSRL